MDIYPNILAVGESTLTKRQKELWVVVVDIGSSSTNVAVYEEGALIYAGVLPIGGEHVTSDLALGLRISIDTAEKLKIEYGDLTIRDTKWKENDEEIDLSKFSSMETMSISRNFMNEIIRARYEEIFHHIIMELIYETPCKYRSTR